MRLPFRIWKSLFSNWARLQQGREQRRAAASKRRSLRRRHELTALETRVVLNAAPVAHDDVFQTTEEVAVPFLDDDLTANDTDPDQDPLSVVGIHGWPQHGSLFIDDGSFVYTPDPGFVGIDEFQYDVSDGELDDRATVRIEVAPAAPTGVTAAPDESGNPRFDLLVTWNDGSAGEDGYEIWTADADEEGLYWQLGGTAADTTAYVETGLAPGQTRHYRIRAFKDVGIERVYSGWTHTESTTESTPYIITPDDAASIDWEGSYQPAGWAVDFESPSFAWSIDDTTNFAIDADTGLVTTPAVLNFGTGYAVTITIADEHGSDSRTITFQLPEEPQPPSITAPYEDGTTVEWEGSYQPQGWAEDYNSPYFAWSIDDTTNFTIDSHGALVTAVGELDPGAYYTVTLTISDEYGSDSTTITFHAPGVPNQAPWVTPGSSAEPAVLDYHDASTQTWQIQDLINAYADGDETLELGDADGPIVGLAITGVDGAGVGVWEFSHNGSDWFEFGGPSEVEALLLAGDDWIRFIPAADGSSTGTATITFRAWDGADGLQCGYYADVTGAGGETAYSSDAGAITVRVEEPSPPPNEAPWVTAGSSAELVGLDFYDSSVQTWQVQDLLDTYADGDATLELGDNDGEVLGLAVTGVDDAGVGLWHYSLDQSNWFALANLSDTEARQLRGDSWLRFTPTADGATTGTSRLTFRAMDGSNGMSPGILVDASGNGGSSAFSSDVGELRVRVDIRPNEAPSFTPGADVAAEMDAGATVVASWATDITAGGQYDQNQSLDFSIDVDRPELFTTAGQPRLEYNPTTQHYDLCFTAAEGAYGLALITTTLSDNGGTAGGGVDTSAPHTFAVALSPFGGGGGGGGEPGQPVVPKVGVLKTTYEATEGEDDNLVRIKVLLSQRTTATVEVEWYAANDTAYADVDFAAAGGTLTFAPGEVEKTIEISLTDDSLDRGDEREFTVVLAAAVGAVLVETHQEARVAITENDATLTIGDASGTEGLDAAENPHRLVFTVGLSRVLDHDVTVQYALSGGSGAGAGDVTGGSGSVTIAAGQTSQEISLEIVNDDASEIDPNDPDLKRGEDTEQVFLEITTSDPHAMIDKPIGVGTIEDDDWKHWEVVEAEHDEPYLRTYTLDDVVDGFIPLNPACEGLNGMLEFEPPPGWESGEFWDMMTVPDHFDWVPTGPQNNSQPSIWLDWLDPQPVIEGPGAKVKFRISVLGIHPNGSPVTVYYRTNAVTAEAGADFQAVTDSMTFTEDGYQDVEITLSADAILEPLENFGLVITNLSGGLISGSHFAQAVIDDVPV